MYEDKCSVRTGLWLLVRVFSVIILLLSRVYHVVFLSRQTQMLKRHNREVEVVFALENFWPQNEGW